jgi:hypothetical protein
MQCVYAVSNVDVVVYRFVRLCRNIGLHILLSACDHINI